MFSTDFLCIVFPPGMYAAGTFVFAEATGPGQFYLISRYFIYAALLKRTGIENVRIYIFPYFH